MKKQWFAFTSIQSFIKFKRAINALSKHIKMCLSAISQQFVDNRTWTNKNNNCSLRSLAPGGDKQCSLSDALYSNNTYCNTFPRFYCIAFQHISTSVSCHLPSPRTKGLLRWRMANIHGVVNSLLAWWIHIHYVSGAVCHGKLALHATVLISILFCCHVVLVSHTHTRSEHILILWLKQNASWETSILDEQINKHNLNLVHAKRIEQIG